jgi:hypothetical protein
MLEEQEHKRYVYTFRTAGRKQNNPEAIDKASYESLLSIKQGLFMLTGGCEIYSRREGYFCKKHGRPVKQGESRCDYLANRFSAAVGETSSKVQIQHYVNDILGIKDPQNVKRLAG